MQHRTPCEALPSLIMTRSSAPKHLHVPNSAHHSLHTQALQKPRQVLLFDFYNAVLEAVDSDSGIRLLNDLLKCVAESIPSVASNHFFVLFFVFVVGVRG